MRNIGRYVRILAVLASASIAPTLFAEAIGIGSTRDEVLETYGPPRSRAQLGPKEIFTYAAGSVTCENGRVVDFRFNRGEPPLRRRPGPQKVEPDVITKTIYIDRPVSIATPPVQPLPSAKSIFGTYWIWIFVAGGLALTKAMTPRKRIRGFDLDGQSSQPQPASSSHRNAAGVSSSEPFPPPPPVIRLDLTALRKMEWRRVEELVQGYFEKTGLRAQRSAVGPDGGIDLFLYTPGGYKPAACVQCKMRSSADIGVKDIREFYGVMMSESLTTGHFISTQGFTADAKAFAQGKPIRLIDGPELVALFEHLPPEDHAAVVTHAFRGDYMTPTCPSCDEKMIYKEAKGGFWGCKSYPRCRRKLPASAGGR